MPYRREGPSELSCFEESYSDCLFSYQIVLRCGFPQDEDISLDGEAFLSWYNSGRGLDLWEISTYNLHSSWENNYLNPDGGYLGRPALHLLQTNVLIFSDMKKSLDINGCCNLGSAIQWRQAFFTSVFLLAFLYDHKMVTTTPGIKMRREKSVGCISRFPSLGKVRPAPEFSSRLTC